jgi:hypothetical protein
MRLSSANVAIFQAAIFPYTRVHIGADGNRNHLDGSVVSFVMVRFFRQQTGFLILD